MRQPKLPHKNANPDSRQTNRKARTNLRYIQWEFAFYQIHYGHNAKKYNYPFKDKKSPCTIIQLVWHSYYITLKTFYQAVLKIT